MLLFGFKRCHAVPEFAGRIGTEVCNPVQIELVEKHIRLSCLQIA